MVDGYKLVPFTTSLPLPLPTSRLPLNPKLRQGLCITCDEIMDALETSSPTPSPSDFEGSLFPETPAPSTASAGTEAPFGIFPETPAPVTPAPVTAAPVPPAPVAPTPAATDAPTSDCVCVNTMSAEEAAVLERRSKKMVCDPTCSDDTDLIWGELHICVFVCGANTLWG